ncbi:unnamed protein product [Owenia fusiformis]|uniref:Uncharacterized protein n=1 Tax=Owenia fusiformis TaxID=6347 RepID=A0A8J1U6J0_OWEFU|nr:unnamed protein product [Owenia fusiformis]
MRILICIIFLGFLKQGYEADSSKSSSEEDKDETISVTKTTIKTTTKSITKEAIASTLSPETEPTIKTTQSTSIKPSTASPIVIIKTSVPSTLSTGTTVKNGERANDSSSGQIEPFTTLPEAVIETRSTSSISPTSTTDKDNKKARDSSSYHSSEENDSDTSHNDGDKPDVHASNVTKEAGREVDNMKAVIIGIIVAVVLLTLMLLATLLFKCYRYKREKRVEVYETITKPVVQAQEVHHHYNYPNNNPAFESYYVEPISGPNIHMRSKPTKDSDNETYIDIDRGSSLVDSGYDTWMPGGSGISQEEPSPEYLEVIND